MSREEGRRRVRLPAFTLLEVPMSEAVKETKAQRVERLKRELNPWEAYADIQRFAREGWDAVPPEWLGTSLPWGGVYTQGAGVRAVGGKGGAGKAGTAPSG